MAFLLILLYLVVGLRLDPEVVLLRDLDVTASAEDLVVLLAISGPELNHGLLVDVAGGLDELLDGRIAEPLVRQRRERGLDALHELRHAGADAELRKLRLALLLALLADLLLMLQEIGQRVVLKALDLGPDVFDLLAVFVVDLLVPLLESDFELLRLDIEAGDLIDRVFELLAALARLHDGGDLRLAAHFLPPFWKRASAERLTDGFSWILLLIVCSFLFTQITDGNHGTGGTTRRRRSRFQFTPLARGATAEK